MKTEKREKRQKRAQKDKHDKTLPKPSDRLALLEALLGVPSTKKGYGQSGSDDGSRSSSGTPSPPPSQLPALVMGVPYHPSPSPELTLFPSMDTAGSVSSFVAFSKPMDQSASFSGDWHFQSTITPESDMESYSAIYDLTPDTSSRASSSEPEPEQTTLTLQSPNDMELSIFDALPPLPDVEDCNALLQVYFNVVGRQFPVLHPQLFSGTRKRSNVPLVLSMMSIACRFHPSKHFRQTHQPTLSFYSSQLLPIAASQQVDVEYVQTLFHLAMAHLSVKSKQGTVVALEMTVAGLRDIITKDPALSTTPGRPGDQGKTLAQWMAEDEARRTAWYIAWLGQAMRGSSDGRHDFAVLGAVEDVPLPTGDFLWQTPLGGVSESVGLSPEWSEPLTLRTFFDTALWPIEMPPKAPVGFTSFEIALTVYCADKVDKYRRFCAKNGISTPPRSPIVEKLSTMYSTTTLHEVSSAMTTLDPRDRAHIMANQITYLLTIWHARLHVLLGVPPPPTCASFESIPATTIEHDIHPVLLQSPEALAMLLLYHLMWSYLTSPIHPESQHWEYTARNFDQESAAGRDGRGSSSSAQGKRGKVTRLLADILLYGDEDTSGPPWYIAEWMTHPAMAVCVGHTNMAVKVARSLLEIHGEERLRGVVKSAGIMNPFTLVIPYLVIMKEMLRVSKPEVGNIQTSPEQFKNGTGTYETFLKLMELQLHEVIGIFGHLRIKWKKGYVVETLLQSLLAEVMASKSVAELDGRWQNVLSAIDQLHWNLKQQHPNEPMTKLMERGLDFM
ncbi:hypothetical protein M427DRAFT_134595 [Gonapodya prolifera JEL478]|uniref:Xylanolytic transcriptional activator regulatory domain-containing protein n=1 Tax=Gonapodya prolifera (strain JEL478) TaxID=1344416 RepID=A0A139AIB3_GONPJ|nr:hypothetical protein M427DRAFT_134595 [Gonapodya prolifera JEL478]|eukprot:KXS16163.1 hypothetical protein M427DRAFT_134595 [Gonapodya prolifera JEL478]